MTEKRYRKVLGLIEDNEGDGDGLLDLTDIENRLNEQHEENQQIRHTIKEAYQTERTQIGKSVLKQLIEQME